MKKVIPFKRSFASSTKAQYWSSKNVLKPRELFLNSNNKYWFNCICGHEFNTTLYRISMGNSWCPYCALPSKKLCFDLTCAICLSKSFASSNRAQFWSSKNEIQPREVFLNSNTKYWFDCICGHEFFSALNNVTKGKWCPFCASQQLCNKNDCTLCISKSFASSNRAQFWSLQNEMNPRNVFLNSDKKCWFDCICGHEFSAKLNHITGGSWCPFCASSPKQLCCDLNCTICISKSFASSSRAQFWSAKNGMQPRDVFLNSNSTYWFDCICGHEFSARPRDITNGHWCPFCASPPQQLCCDLNCIVCLSKSFAKSDKVQFWSPKNTIQPREVFMNANKKYVFDCGDCGNEFSAALNNITTGTWCPFCMNKTEGKLMQFLKSSQFEFKSQFRAAWCVSNETSRKLPFDFCAEANQIIIELDGRQHFEQVMNWKSPEAQLTTDLFKQKAANANGYSTIRLLQEDVWGDKIDWGPRLLAAITTLAEIKTVQNIYICDSELYALYETNS